MTQLGTPPRGEETRAEEPPWKVWLQALLLALVLYVFLVSIGLLGSSFKLFRMPEGADQGYPGVLPDHWVKQTLDDYRAGRDTAMEYVKARWS